MDRESQQRVLKADTWRQIVYGEVYAPYQLDSHGEMMLPEDIELMAHRFMRLDLSRVIDVNHDNRPIKAYPVESFIAREGDPDFTPGSWVLGVKIEDPVVWNMVLRGELNAFSFEAFVRPREATIRRSYVRDRFGETEALPSDGHTHMFFVQLDENDRVVFGTTSPGPDGHVHEIRSISVTETSAGHAHRFFL